jgi:hypothetical protein
MLRHADAAKSLVVAHADGSTNNFADDVRPDRLWRYYLVQADRYAAAASFTGIARTLSQVASRPVVTKAMVLQTLDDAIEKLCGMLAIDGIGKQALCLKTDLVTLYAEATKADPEATDRP